jgi:hypothetical protein
MSWGCVLRGQVYHVDVANRQEKAFAFVILLTHDKGGLGSESSCGCKGSNR